ncbi:hypothetical protein BT96DRAFT_917348 [Gymnopus androsaceus JB14]|uniref:EKC/KEOPS complex subunit GON7 n=1 Tax=Gymnopus androsaceus JB14 TaxID=1447944 RepID=A0A6A4HWU3_9AGAR|nr:hypothetical protein BT96DRAFT_917348 [Gymnopus androsaceus JB14]
MSYTVQPPAGTNLPEISPSRTLQVAVNVPKDQPTKKYYGALHEALAEARNKIGDDLTIWRDAVGKLEINKETKRPTKAEDEEDEEEEEQE